MKTDYFFSLFNFCIVFNYLFLEFFDGKCWIYDCHYNVLMCFITYRVIQKKAQFHIKKC